MTRHEKAKALFLQGYNCSQAVIGAFCADCGLNFETAMKLSSSFGGGIARQREVCGAVSGMCMVAGLLKGYSSPDDKAAKKSHYEFIQCLCGKFREENGSIICRELLGLGGCKTEASSNSPVPGERTSAYYKKRPCAELVEMAAIILENNIPSVSGEIS